MRQRIPVVPSVSIALAECSIFSAGLNAVPQLDRVAGPGPWTLLVPTDEAFASLSTAALNDLVYNSLPLTELLRSHVVRGMFASRDLPGEGWLLTVRGDYLPVDAFGGVVLIDGAQVLRGDVRVACGVAHVIDRVLLRER